MAKAMKKRTRRTFKVWAIMARQDVVCIGYPGSSRQDVKKYECQQGERIAAATLTLDPPKPKRKKEKPHASR